MPINPPYDGEGVTRRPAEPGEVFMHEITIRQLEYFLAVIDEGSISAAARRLHISQAATSMALQQLERSLNAELLSRSAARRAQPTPAGQSLMPHARRVIQSVADATESVRDDHSQMRGVLRVISSMTVSPHVLPLLLAHFAEHHPEVRVEISERSVVEIHEALSRGEADLGVVYARQASADFNQTVIEDGHQHVMLPARHPLSLRDSVRLGELIEEPLILVDIPPSVERVTQLIRDLGLEPSVRWTSGNFETVRSLVGYGLGWSFVNIVPFTCTTYDGLEVGYVPIVDDIPSNPVVAMIPRHHEPSARVREALRVYMERRARGHG